MAIGRAWASDAVLTRIDVGRVSATGVVDLGGEAGSGYRFVSPGRHERWVNETEAGGKSLTATGLMLEIKGTQVRALPHEERADGIGAGRPRACRSPGSSSAPAAAAASRTSRTARAT